MQELGDLTITESSFLTADELREITASKEELFETQVLSIKTNFQETMVKLAREQGRLDYSAHFRKEDDTSVLDKIVEEFRALDYTVSVSDTLQKMGDDEIPVVTLTVSWAK